MSSFAAALTQIKGRLVDSIPTKLIERLAREVGHHWRERSLGPVLTTRLFLQQVLRGNVPIGELRHLSGVAFTPAGYCQARTRLPRQLLERLQQEVTQTLESVTALPADERWLGHRVFLVDGSSFSMPDTAKLQRKFGQPGGQVPGCGFPVAHLMTRFDAATGYLLQTIALPLRSHDSASVPALHAELSPGDVLVGDRAFCSYTHLALGQQRGVSGLFRAHQKQIISFQPHRAMAKKGEKGKPRSRWLKRLGKHDQLVEYFKPKHRPEWLSAKQYAKLPATLVVREWRYTIREPGRRTRVVTLVTTLLDPERYPAAALARLFGLRWQVETNLRHLKQTLHMDVLRCETPEGVLKELTVFVLIYNLV